MESTYKRVLQDIEKKRDNRINGQINCIPWGFPRFEQECPGLEQGRSIIFTANSKVGKSQISDQMCIYSPYEYLDNNPEIDIKLKVFNFSLEMSKEEKIRQAICRKLFIDKGILIDTKTLGSKRRNEILSQEILDIIKTYEAYFDKFCDTVTYIDSIKNPYGIYKMIRDYANANGKQHKKMVKFERKQEDGSVTSTEELIDDYYEPNNPNEYVVVMVDHVGLLQPEKDQDLRTAIGKYSSDYSITMRNKWNYIPVIVQQQAQAQESIENAKMDRLHPTLDGLGDNKTTQRDANIIFGLFSPFRHKIPKYPVRDGYDVTKFQDHIRFLEILGGREGGANTICPLYFHGAVNYFKELPEPTKLDEIDKVYEFMRNLNQQKQNV